MSFPLMALVVLSSLLGFYFSFWDKYNLVVLSLLNFSKAIVSKSGLALVVFGPE